MIYQATITSRGGENKQTYVGLAKRFKPRYSKHKTSMSDPTPKTSTTLSSHFLKEKAAGHNPIITWKFLKANIPTFNPVTDTCKLCLCEKLYILYKPELASLNSRSELYILYKPELANLNSRSEMFSAGRHKRSELLVPPDPKSHGG